MRSLEGAALFDNLDPRLRGDERLGDSTSRDKGNKGSRPEPHTQTAAGVVAAIVALSSSAFAQDKPVFGLVMSFSGWFQPIDADTIAGAKLAVDDINAAGGVLGQPIEIVEFDNKSEPPLGADGAIEVIGKGAKAILFPSDFDFGAPGAFVAQQKNVIAFSGASDPKFGVQGVGPLAYSISNAGQAQGALMAEWAFNEKGWKKAYVLLDNTIAYTKSLCGSFAATRWKEASRRRRRCSARTPSSTATPRSPRR